MMIVKKKINGEWVKLQEQVMMLQDKTVSVYSIMTPVTKVEPVKSDAVRLRRLTTFGGGKDD